MLKTLCKTLFVSKVADSFLQEGGGGGGNICALFLSSFVGSAMYKDFAIIPCPIVVLVCVQVRVVLCCCIADIIAKKKCTECKASI
jgi:hypothetical protein